MANRRMLIVLGSLVFGMTITSGVLLVLEPGPMPVLPNVAMMSTRATGSAEERLFGFQSQPGDWQAILIHDSGAARGSAASLTHWHARTGVQPLAYHFVINNGSEAQDGLVEVGPRWRQQIGGPLVQGPGAEWYRRHAIGICLVGNAQGKPMTDAQHQRLVWLVQHLQARFGIAADRVHLQLGGGDAASGHFRDGWFRRQLLDR